MKKHLLLLLSLLFVATAGFAERVSQDDAALVATNFMNAGSTATRSGAKAASPKKMVLKKAATATSENQYYVYENASGEGWVMVSASDVAHPILAYSETGKFRTDNQPDNIKHWLGKYDKVIKQAEASGQTASEEVAAEWTALRDGSTLKTATVVAALCKTTWDQGAPYNNLCPTYNNQHAATGCVATALAQVMKYWEWPEKGVGSHTYHPIDADTEKASTKYGDQTADFANTTYDWANMKDSYSGSSSTSAQKTAVATLMFHCGVAVEMMYGDESAAYTGNYEELYGPDSENPCSEVALKTYFKYKSSVKSYLRDGYTEGSTVYRQAWSDDDWIAMLKVELDAGRPILYGGSGSAGGHSFICDGYDSSNKFHFNWGWSGSNDGFYALNNLAPGSGGVGGGSYIFNDDQDVVIGIEPDKPSSPVTSISISPTTVTLKQKESQQLTATVLPTDAVQTVTWYSSNTAVATVSSTGKVKGISAGTAIITAAANDDSGVKATRNVTITNEVAEVTECDAYSYEYTAKVGDGTQALGAATWNIALEAGAVQNFDGTRGEHFGSNNTPAKSVTYTSSSFADCLINEIVIEATAGSGSGTLEVSIGETSLGQQNISGSNAAYTFTNTTEAQGDVKFVVAASTKALYVKSIAVNQNGGGGQQEETEVTLNPTVAEAYLYPEQSTTGNNKWEIKIADGAISGTHSFLMDVVFYTPSASAIAGTYSTGLTGQLEYNNTQIAANSITMTLAAAANTSSLSRLKKSSTARQYNVVVNYEGADGKTYKINKTVSLTAYNASTDEDPLTPPDPGTSGTATFVFNTDEGIAALGIAKPEMNNGTNLGTDPYTSGVISMAATSGSTATRVWSANNTGVLDLRIYTNGTLTFTGATITKIELAGGAVNNFSATVGTFASGTWEGNSAEVVLTATGTGKINTITVTYSGDEPTPNPSIKAEPASLSFTGSLVGGNFSESKTITVTGTALSTSLDEITVTKSGTYESLFTVNKTSLPATGGELTVTFETNGAYDGYEATLTLESMDANDNIISINVPMTANIAAEAVKHTVTWSVLGSTSTAQFDDGAALTLPANPADCENGKKFVGWTAETSVSAKPADLFTEAGSKTVTADVTYYAVFATAGSGSGSGSSTVTDELDAALTGITSTQYGEWSGKMSNSDAVYAGQSAKSTAGAIQIRSNNSNSGIVTTTSGGKVQKVTITWNSATSGKTLQVYGSNNAYTAATDLYGDNKGTLLGTIASDTQTELAIEGDYAYIGVRSASGAIYIDKIEIAWATAGGSGTTYSDYSLTCTETPAASITTTPESLSFEAMLESGEASAEKSIIVTGANLAEVIEAKIIDDAEGNFSLKNASGGKVELPASGGDLTVEFYAIEAGNYTAKLHLYSLDANVADVVKEVDLSATVTAPAVSYTVTIASGILNGSVTADPMSATEGTTVTLTATPDDGYKLDAWSVLDANNEPIIVTDNKFVMPAGNVTVSATFVEKPAEQTYVLTALASIKATDEVIITMTNSTGTFALYSANGTKAPTAVAVTVENDAISTSEENIYWNIAKDGDSLIIYPNGVTDKYLYATNTNNGVRVGTYSTQKWAVDATSGYLVFNATRYLGVYNSSDWRTYTSATATNIANQTLAFYVKSSGVTPQPTTHTVKWFACGSEFKSETYEDGAALVLPNPAPETNESGKAFVGWTTAEYENYTGETAPTLITSGTVNADVNYYAVYK